MDVDNGGNLCLSLFLCWYLYLYLRLLNMHVKHMRYISCIQGIAMICGCWHLTSIHHGDLFLYRCRYLYLYLLNMHVKHMKYIICIQGRGMIGGCRQLASVNLQCCHSSVHSSYLEDDSR